MPAEITTQIREWLDTHTDGHISAAPESEQLPMVLKRAHTLRVAEDARGIAHELAWSRSDVDLAEAVGLLHDIARFEQYVRYGTFLDAASFDHGIRGRDIACECPALSGLAARDKETLLTAIQFHNKRDIPTHISGNDLKHLQLIRDADKIDILHSITLILKEGWHLKHPGILLNIDPGGDLTQELVDEMLRTSTGSYENVKTLPDMHLMRVGWVHSIVYTPALRRIAERNLYDSAIPLLPDTPEVTAICDRAVAYVNDRLQSA